jgi:cell division protein ZapA
MEEKLSINLNIADRFYPLRIDSKEEEKLRKAAKYINEKVLQYKQKYADKDEQDFLAMSALQFVIKLMEAESKTDVVPVIQTIQEINHELEAFLEKEK